MKNYLSARQRILNISLGWISVAVVEACAYLMLAFAIVEQQQPSYLLAIALIALIITVLVTRTGFVSGVRLAGDLYQSLNTALAGIKLSWFNDSNRALLVNTASRGIPSLMSVPAHQLQSYLYAPLIPLLLLVGIFSLGGWQLGLVTTLLLSISLVMQYLAQRALSKADSQRHGAELATTQSTLELVDHLELLRTAAGSLRSIERLERSWLQQESALIKTNRAAAGALFCSTIASILPLAGSLVFLLYLAPIDLATVLALTILVMRAAAPIETLALAGLGINDLKATVADYQKILAAPCLLETSTPQQATGYELHLHQLSHAPVLRDISSCIPEGSCVAITGASGAGKSTLLGLLMRFDDPENGAIYLGGVPLTALKYSDLASKIAYVAQNPIVFTGTLAHNIRQGCEQASDEQVERAAKAALLDDVLARSALGIEQEVGHQGSALSGGERQRVALARAFLKQAPILILDEATSALDEKTELAIIDHIQSLAATVILVTHRSLAAWQVTHRITL